MAVFQCNLSQDAEMLISYHFSPPTKMHPLDFPIHTHIHIET